LAIIWKIDKINQALFLQGGKCLIKFFADTIKNKYESAKHCFISWDIGSFFFNENSSITAFIINSQLFNFAESRIYAHKITKS